MNYLASERDRILATLSALEVLDYVSAGGSLSPRRVAEARRELRRRHEESERAKYGEMRKVIYDRA